MKYLTPALVERTISNARGTVFSVTYDNDEGLSRTITARTGAKSLRDRYTVGDRLMILFDMTNRKYSYINKTKVRKIKANRRTVMVSTPL